MSQVCQSICWWPQAYVINCKPKAGGPCDFTGQHMKVRQRLQLMGLWVLAGGGRVVEVCCWVLLWMFVFEPLQGRGKRP